MPKIITEAPTEKKCSICREIRPVANFSRVGTSSKTGFPYYNSRCIECNQSYCTATYVKQCAKAARLGAPDFENKKQECRICGETKPLSQFYRSKRYSKSGFAGITVWKKCKACSYIKNGSKKDKLRANTELISKIQKMLAEGSNLKQAYNIIKNEFPCSYNFFVKENRVGTFAISTH